jgi:hypothetical protein
LSNHAVMRYCGSAVLPLCRLAHSFCSERPGGLRACLSMVVVNHPVSEHTRGQRPNANLVRQTR